MTIYLLLVLSQLLSQYMNVQAEKSALCFLTHRPAPETLRFAEELAQDTMKYCVDVFIMIDDNHFQISKTNISSNLQLLQILNNKYYLR